MSFTLRSWSNGNVVQQQSTTFNILQHQHTGKRASIFRHPCLSFRYSPSVVVQHGTGRLAQARDIVVRMFAPGHRRELLAWLLPVALATTSAPAVAATPMDELRRRRIVAPGPSIVERLVAAGLVLAERHVAVQLTCALAPEQVARLDALLQPKEPTAMSVLAWSRQPPGRAG